MIRAILFDLDGTLIDRDAAHERYCLDFMGRHPGAFLPGRREGDLCAMTRHSRDDGWDRRAFARGLSRAFPGLGLTPLQIAADYAERVARFVVPDPAVTRLVAGLSLRHRLAVVSNGSRALQRAKLTRAGLVGLFAGVFVSGELGIAKPAPALYRRVLAWAGCAADEALFVGDDVVRDVAGAAAVGIRTCWVAGGRPFPADRPAPDLTIQRLLDLPDVLR